MKKMETTISRAQTAFRLSTELLKRLKVEARKQNRSLNNFVESVLMDAVYRTPNAATMAAVKVGSMSGHKEGSKVLARYRDIDQDIKK